MEQGIPPVAGFKAPLYVAWEITHKCNARCKHCYSNSSPDAVLNDELSTDEAITVIDQLADAGILVLAFSGGEPMLRHDWRTLVQHAVARGLSVNVGTNGSCITLRTARELYELRVQSVTVSLDSHRADVHDEFRGLPGLYKKANNAVRLLIDAGVRVVVGFTPTRLNWRHGYKVVELAHRLGADAVNLSEFVPAGRGSIDLALSPKELRSVLEEWVALREFYQGHIQVMWHDCRVGMLVSEGDRRNYVGCGAGRLVARVCPDGTVTPCVFLPTPIGSLRRQTFTDLWQHSYLLKQFRDREGHITGNCGECEHLDNCGGCRAVAYAYSKGNPLAGDCHCWVKESPNGILGFLADGEALPI